MKKFANLGFLVLTFAFLAGCSSSGGRAAGPSGKIVIYTSMYEHVIAAVSKALEKEFPNCDINFVYGGTGQIQARVASEYAAGRLGCDMLMVAEPTYSMELQYMGILHSYVTPEEPYLAYEHCKDFFWYPVRVSNMVLAYNPEKNAKSAVPNSFYDFANNAGARGAISMSNPLTSGTTMAAVAALKDKYGYEYFEALGRQNVAIESGAVALEKLESGQYKAIMILEESVLKERQENGSKVEVIYPEDGVINIPSTIMSIDEKFSANKNIRAAEAITDWFLSEQGQSVIVDGWMHSVRKDFAKKPFDSISEGDIRLNSIPMLWINHFRERDEVQSRFEELITSRRQN